jgi:hypothetical protein
MRSPSDRPIREDRQTKVRTPAGSASRDERLKAALKANMARRKAQAKARGGEDPPGDTTGKD